MTSFLVESLVSRDHVQNESPVPTRYQRVKTGCLTCRRRKKKCDEVKPRCAGCRRNQKQCEWTPTTFWDASPIEQGFPEHDSAPASARGHQKPFAVDQSGPAPSLSIVG